MADSIFLSPLASNTACKNGKQMQLTQLLPDLEAQLAFGALLGASVPHLPLVVTLEGELGSGKTTLTRGVLRGLGYHGTVRSPTYTLLEPYPIGERCCAHLDLYRLGDPEELEFLGLRDLLAEGCLLLVEWPQRGRGVLPEEDLRITLRYLQQGREITLVSENSAADQWLREVRSRLPQNSSPLPEESPANN